jgi:hypothetical protein
MLAGLALLAGTMAQAADTALPRLEDFKWVARPIVVFADAPQDPRLVHQLSVFESDMAELEARDVEIIVDTSPGEKTPLRTRFHPRDFNVILIDKDGTVIYRKPNPVTVSEIIRLIDRTTIRQQELEAQRNITN